MIGPTTLTSVHKIMDDHPVAKYGRMILREPRLTFIYSPITQRYYLAVWINRANRTVKELPARGKTPNEFGPAVWRSLLKVDHRDNFRTIKDQGKEAALDQIRRAKYRNEEAADRRERFKRWNDRNISKGGWDFSGSLVETTWR